MNTRNYIDGSLACQSLGDCSLFEVPVFCKEENVKQTNKQTTGKKFDLKNLFQKIQNKQIKAN